MKNMRRRNASVCGLLRVQGPAGYFRQFDTSLLTAYFARKLSCLNLRAMFAPQPSTRFGAMPGTERVKVPLQIRRHPRPQSETRRAFGSIPPRGRNLANSIARQKGLHG